MLYRRNSTRDNHTDNKNIAFNGTFYGIYSWHCGKFARLLVDKNCLNFQLENFSSKTDILPSLTYI